MQVSLRIRILIVLRMMLLQHWNLGYFVFRQAHLLTSTLNSAKLCFFFIQFRQVAPQKPEWITSEMPSLETKNKPDQTIFLLSTKKEAWHNQHGCSNKHPFRKGVRLIHGIAVASCCIMQDQLGSLNGIKPMIEKKRVSTALLSEMLIQLITYNPLYT